ncbi:cell wall hydrolase [Parasporobacterium paucivorans]|uniref:Cell Wall Hydrolase n=1 Tax=Parasporobacterium paucivorans DSM 15970 TaxID=1122934 RepID=A0A1M6G4T4_9FIRM|nr:cell wall hydrolase [Parasporobacterium paucivorans]SHJ05006.1 Cell Wall Hydrolase [Parasporobacterium paucivorans DSM 15970]
MLNLRSFFSRIFGFIKSVSKKMHRNYAIITAGMVIVAIIALASNDFGGAGKSKAMASSNIVSETGTEELETEEAANSNPNLPAVVTPVAETTEIDNTGAAIEETTAVAAVTETNVIGIEVSAQDYDALCRIVQAEAGGEDEIGRIMVANVVLNRVRSEKFPNSITEVIYERSNGIPQFQPTNKQSFGTIEVSDSTRACVDRALAGEDYAKGALFFAVQTSADSWFNTCLTFLYEYSGHYFYM